MLILDKFTGSVRIPPLSHLQKHSDTATSALLPHSSATLARHQSQRKLMAPTSLKRCEAAFRKHWVETTYIYIYSIIPYRCFRRCAAVDLGHSFETKGDEWWSHEMVMVYDGLISSNIFIVLLDILRTSWNSMQFLEIKGSNGPWRGETDWSLMPLRFQKSLGTFQRSLGTSASASKRPLKANPTKRDKSGPRKWEDCSIL